MTRFLVNVILAVIAIFMALNLVLNLVLGLGVLYWTFKVSGAA